MKNDQKQQAKNLFFDTNLSKMEIADQVGVNRRTIMLWCQQGNWDKLKLSGRHLPALVAEKCYYLIDHIASTLLTEGPGAKVTHKDADAINKLASGIKKLRNRCAVNESMEMFNFFLEYLRKNDEQLAPAVLPHMERYMESRKNIPVNDFILEEFNLNGYLPYPIKDLDERNWDKMDTEAFNKELLRTGDYDQALENWQNEKDQSDAA